MTEKKTNKRVAVQIAVAPGTPGTEDRNATPDILYALASDGSMWWFSDTSAQAWYRIPDLPQGKLPT